jgi:AcrR family transcriptional regulator
VVGELPDVVDRHAVGRAGAGQLIGPAGGAQPVAHVVELGLSDLDAVRPDRGGVRLGAGAGAHLRLLDWNGMFCSRIAERNDPFQYRGGMEQQTRPGGRRAQAARNSERILSAAAEVFVADPKAPMSAVADRAGVGMSALYSRYESKEVLLRQLCHAGLRRYVAEAEHALTHPDPWDAFSGFLRAVVEADVHSLTVQLAGTFDPTAEMGEDAARAGALTAQLVEGAQRGGQLREDLDPQDVTLLLEMLSAVRLEEPGRTTQLRERCLTLLLDGLRGPGPVPLPGPPPTAEELGRRWTRRTGG